MLRIAARLTKKKDFEAVFSGGPGVRAGSLVVKHAKKGPGVSRVGFVVSTKVSGKAVERNTVKRRLRAAFGKMRVKGEVDIVVVALPGSAQKTAAELAQFLEVALSRSRLLL